MKLYLQGGAQEKSCGALAHHAKETHTAAAVVASFS